MKPALIIERQHLFAGQDYRKNDILWMYRRNNFSQVFSSVVRATGDRDYANARYQELLKGCFFAIALRDIPDGAEIIMFVPADLKGDK